MRAGRDRQNVDLLRPQRQPRWPGRLPTRGVHAWYLEDKTPCDIGMKLQNLLNDIHWSSTESAFGRNPKTRHELGRRVDSSFGPCLPVPHVYESQVDLGFSRQSQKIQ